MFFDQAWKISFNNLSLQERTIAVFFFMGAIVLIVALWGDYENIK
ncbi:MAG: hypothetical protein QQW96_24240 [Tychonema bourrellyi B0820]|nr:hypothetical protein [Tychonema bourrellyi]MDQ2100742.1 hypothetical protein [Tychonema bourrellyi B0820]